MGHPVKRNSRKINRPKSPTYSFTTRRLEGLPTKDDAATRAEKDKLIAEFLEKRKGTKDGPQSR